jgi:serine/threonine protein kinase
VKVVDFGLAKMRAEVASNVTSPGIVCGTPDYMAPEQGRGDAIDSRSDLYACGVIIYQLLTGGLPFEGDSPTQVVLMHMSKRPLDPREAAPRRNIPKSLAEVCLKALEKDAKDRYQTADELSEALGAALVEPRSPRGGPRATIDERHLLVVRRGIVPRGQKFCGECGARIVSLAPPAKPADARPRAAIARACRPCRCRSRIAKTISTGSPAASWRPRPRSSRSASSAITGSENPASCASSSITLDGEELVVRAGPDPWSAEVGYFTLRTPCRPRGAARRRRRPAGVGVREPRGAAGPRGDLRPR